MGKITVYTGPMFSRKTAFLLAEYERSMIAEKKVVAFKPVLDGRFGDHVIASRNAGSIEAKCISTVEEIQNYDAQDYFIDEFQFLTGEVRILQKMANNGKTFYIAGLDMTAEGKPFPIMADLLAIADVVEKRTAICVDCKCDDAVYSFFLAGKKQDILVGDKEYVPLCRKCWQARMNKRSLTNMSD